MRSLGILGHIPLWVPGQRELKLTFHHLIPKDAAKAQQSHFMPHGFAHSLTMSYSWVT